EKVQVNFLPRMHLEPSAGKRVLLEPLVDERVLLEPVVFHLMQAVQNRTKWLKNAQIKNGARAHIEPDASKR
ncbi:hypothetical protein, partial [Atopobium sp. oral taxon 810]|uniref:hypothetical protein n=1 Tax=Atopobium sp. oral taxon 810 TaxID=712158 RepID=UPI000397E82B